MYVDIHENGYYPDKIGEIEATIASLPPGKALKPIDLTRRTLELERIDIFV